MTYVIRDARDDELAAIQELTLAAYEQYATIMTPPAWEGLNGAIRSALASTLPSQRVVADQDGALIGSVMLFPPDVAAYDFVDRELPVPELRLLAVADNARGQGVGRALTEECIRRARQSGAAELGLHTSKSLVAAIHLYESMGFVRYPPDDFQPPNAELITAYRLRLDGKG